MKVLQFIPSMDVRDGGTATYMQQLSGALGQLVSLHICCLKPKDGDYSHWLPLNHATLHRIEGRIWHWQQMKKEWLALLEKVNPDIVHINCCWMPQCAYLAFCFNEWRNKHRRSSAYVFMPHGMLEPWIMSRHYWTRKLPAIILYQRKAVKHADLVLATAQSEKEHLETLGWNPRIAMVPNGIDVLSIAPKQEWTDNQPWLFMSRLHPKKGLEMLIDAYAQLHDEFSDHKNMPRLVIAGDGEDVYVQKLQEMIVRRGLDGLCLLVGPVYGQEKWRLLCESSCLILPSYSENFGLIVAEALASGIPVLTTQGTPWQTLVEYDCGWWINTDVEVLKQTLSTLLSLSADDLAAMGRRGRAMVEQKYSAQSQAQKMFEIYKKMFVVEKK